MLRVNQRLVTAMVGLVLLVEFGWLIFSETRNNIIKNTLKKIRPSSLLRREPIQCLPYFQNVLKNTSLDTTVVTAYFDLGEFRKGPADVHFTKKMYFDWSKTFQYVVNPLVVYTDSVEFKKHMMDVRNVSWKHTQIFMIEMSSSWAFENLERIKQIFSFKKYPKYFPNTVYPAYTCAQHAKYDVLERAARSNFFSTKFYMWLDIGYFRSRKTQRMFYLQKPQDYNDSKIAMNLINSKLPMTTSTEDIMKKNLVWVGGGLVFGEKEQIIKFAAQFRNAVTHFLSRGLANTDQQVIYGMFSKSGCQIIKPEVELQLYKSSHENDWFYLGNIMAKDV